MHVYFLRSTTFFLKKRCHLRCEKYYGNLDFKHLFIKLQPMKTIILAASLTILNLHVNAQNNEFNLYSNGLIYSENAMTKLSRVADSLNLKYRTCDINKTYYSKQQVVGNLVTLTSGNIQEAKKDMDQGMALDAFIQKYPNVKLERDILILRSKYTNYQGKELVEVEHFNLKNGYGFSIESSNLEDLHKNVSNQWLYQYTPPEGTTKERLSGFYFSENFTSVVLPQTYSSMVGYSECMIDTNTTKLIPPNGSDDSDLYTQLPSDWSSWSLEKKTRQLQDLRAMQVVGFCSQDSRPRQHAVDIALLAAETYNWEVFVKAHLDIMNDRFERMSDGSYAYGKRNTYIKELESININVKDLIFGICLRIENPSSNHYYGSIRRVGRALAESSNKAEIEQALLEIITDKTLDLYNRFLFYFLFENYNAYLADETAKKANEEKLVLAAKSFSLAFQQQLQVE